MSGSQSTSIALLDANRSGIVLSSIHHRDQARLYAKQVHDGAVRAELSPEENEAIRLALRAATASRAGPVAPGHVCASATSGPEGTFTHEALLGARADGGASN